MVRLRAHAKWLVCEEVCIPGEGDFELALPVADSASQPNLVNESLRDDFALARMALPKQLDGAPAVFSTNQQIEVQSAVAKPSRTESSARGFFCQ